MYGIGDFQRDKMHAYKFLWLFERRVELVIGMMSDIDDDDPISKIKMFPSIARSANDRLLIETGMAEHELLDALTIGTYIAEFREMQKMTQEELDEYIALMESDAIFDGSFPGFGEAFQHIKKDYEESKNREKDFLNIIKKNFGEDSL